MFIQNLNKAQQSALLFLAKEIAEADGNADELQLGMADILLKQCEQGVTAKAVSADELAALFDSKKAKYSLLLELLGIAYANDEYHSNEQELVAKYAKKLSVSSEELNTLEIWIERQLALSKEINELLN